MTIESKDLLVAIKAFSRGEKLPLDASEIHESLEQAQAYASSPTAYAGQTIKVLQDGKYVTYVLNPSGDNLVLEKVGVDASAVKNYVQVVDELPSSGQEQGVIYIAGTTGSIWNGTEFKTVFEDIQPLETRVEALETSIKDVYTKSEADSKIAEAVGKITTLKRTVVDNLESVETPDENTIYMVAKANGEGNQKYDEYMYINGAFEKIGDTEVDLSDYAKTADVESKIAEAKTEVTSDLEGKIAIAKQEAIDTAGTNADAKISAKLGVDWPADKTVQDFVKEQVDGVTTGETITNIKNDISALQTTVNKNTTDIATKLDETAVDARIKAKVGEIPEDKTVKDFIGDIGNSSTVADFVKAQVVSGSVTDDQLKSAVKAVTGDPGKNEDGQDITVVQYIDKALTITEF